MRNLVPDGIVIRDYPCGFRPIRVASAKNRAAFLFAAQYFRIPSWRPCPFAERGEHRKRTLAGNVEKKAAGWRNGCGRYGDGGEKKQCATWPHRNRTHPDRARLEKRLLKVLKGLAETLDLSLGDLLEGIALHALENKPPFSASTLKKIADWKRVYGLDLGAANSHRLHEKL